MFVVKPIATQLCDIYDSGMKGKLEDEWLVDESVPQES